jgi:RNA polymerase sigma-70 factor (ECF subfamily)
MNGTMDYKLNWGQSGLTMDAGHLTRGGQMSDGVDVDAKLVERVQKGDKRAFDMLVVKYQHKIYALVSRLVNDHAEVQDVTQESFIKAYRALPNFRGDSAFYTWLYRIAVNTAKNYLVSKNRRPPGSDIDIDDAAQFAAESGLRDIDSPEQQLQGEQMIKIVDRAIAALPEDLRTALSLREFDGLSYEEIAQVMQCPVGTVRSRIFRAREAIDKELEPLMHKTRA